MLGIPRHHAAASLKPVNPPLVYDVINGSIPRHHAAASLKLQFDCSLLATWASIPRHHAAASLKPIEDTSDRLCVERIPRHHAAASLKLNGAYGTLERTR